MQASCSSSGPAALQGEMSTLSDGSDDTFGVWDGSLATEAVPGSDCAEHSKSGCSLDTSSGKSSLASPRMQGLSLHVGGNQATLANFASGSCLHGSKPPLRPAVGSEPHTLCTLPVCLSANHTQQAEPTHVSGMKTNNSFKTAFTPSVSKGEAFAIRRR